jgi:RNA polymerase sigma factor (sigma-70 family)
MNAMEIPDRKNLLLDQIRRMATLQQLRQMPDRELLAQFAGQGNEAAFRVLMDRYGKMVLRVCKRILGNDHDAEDAYQATFFVLASKAGSQPWQESVGVWLHSVAVRTARKARCADQRRRLREQKAMEKKAVDATADVSLRETCGFLEEEIARLPEKYRTPLIQCELISRRQDEVAREQGCSVRTLQLRLERAKALLQKRMAARGLTLTSILLSLMLSPPSEASAVPPELAANTLRNLLLFVRGQEAVAATGAAANPVAAKLAGLTIRGMFLAKIRTRMMGVLLALVLAGSGLGAWRIGTFVPDTANSGIITLPADEAPAVPVGGGKVVEREMPAQTAEPMALVRGKVLDAAGHAVPFAEVTALVRRPFRPGEQGLRDEVVTQGKADEQGMFRLHVPAQFPSWFPERQVVLVAKSPGHAPLTTLVRLAEQGEAQVDLRLTKAEQVIRGCLLAPDGKPAPGVRLRVIRLGDVARETVQGVAEHDGPDLGWPGPVVSDAKGCFTLSGIDPEQGVWLQVEDDRYAPDAFGLRGADSAGRPPAPSWRRYDPDAFGMEVRLKPAQVLEGRILAADTGKALAGVKLSARFAGQDLMPGRYTVPDYLSVSARVLRPASLDGVTGADGRFRLRPPVGPKTVIEVHPPADSPYLAVCKDVDWPEGIVQQTLAVTLPRGVVVRGRVVNEDGAPVAGASVQFSSPAQGNPAYRPDVIQGRHRIVLAGKDGQFSLTVPDGPVRLLVHGPTHEYRPQALRYWSLLAEEPKCWGWREPSSAERRSYTHAEQQLKLTPAENPPEVQLQLVRGQSVAGRVVGPDGEPIKSAVLLCSEKVSPLRNATVQPLPVREGCYELPGCVPGRVYPVLFLDAVNGWGAAVDLMVGRGAGPEVKLACCGSARVQLLNAKGRPMAGYGSRLALMTERSFPADKLPLERESDGHLSVCYDPRHYSTEPVSDGEGWLTLPALIPGARYVLEYADVEGVLRHTPEFRVEPGEQLQLPELAIRDRQ